MKTKVLLFILFCLFNSPLFAIKKCKNADARDSSTFCASFVEAARCYCENQIGGVCQKMTMQKIYQLMMDRFGSLKVACDFQKDTTPQTCIDDWNCYRNGGVDSTGKLCSGTGLSCPAS